MQMRGPVAVLGIRADPGDLLSGRDLLTCAEPRQRVARQVTVEGVPLVRRVGGTSLLGLLRAILIPRFTRAVPPPLLQLRARSIHPPRAAARWSARSQAARRCPGSCGR